jgi:hypothetical protein
MHKKIKFFLLLFALSLLVAVAALPGLRVAGQAQKTAEQEDAVTKRQKEHSKLYGEYKTGRKISELVAEIGDVKIRRNTPLSGGDLAGYATDPHESLRRMTCDADAVVIGKIQNKLSQISESQDFVFTDYEMRVAEVLKDNEASPTQPGTNLIITRPGGTIRMNGKTVEAIDNAFEPFTLEGQYLLFLRFIPATGAYKALGSKSSFQLRGKEIRKLTKETVSLESETNGTDVDAFVNEIRTVLSGGCPKVVTQ